MAEPLTEKEIFEALHLWYPMHGISWIADFGPLLQESRRFAPYLSQMQDNTVVEIGPGNNPITNYFQCEKYESAEAHPGKDGLTLLRKMPDRSAVVVSVGVICDDVLLNKRSAFSEQLTRRYIDELAGEIWRVMSPFALVIGSEASKYLGEPVVNLGSCGGIYLPS